MTEREEFAIPDEWELSEQQEFVIGSLIDARGSFVTAPALCAELYPYDKGSKEAKAPAPAKLRVLVQRCRELVKELTNGRAEIDTKRGKGWRITKKNRMVLIRANR